MEDATNCHSQDLAASALREAATPCLFPMVARVNDRTPSGKQKEGLLPTGKNFFGFIADTCHSSYRSNGKSTSLHPLSGCDLSKIALTRLTLPRALYAHAARVDTGNGAA